MRTLEEYFKRQARKARTIKAVRKNMKPKKPSKFLQELESLIIGGLFMYAIPGLIVWMIYKIFIGN